MSLSVKYSNAERIKRSIAGAIVGGLFLTLPSCNIPCLRCGQAAPELPGVYKPPPVETAPPVVEGMAGAANPAPGTPGSEDLPPPPAAAGGAGDVNLAGGAVSWVNSADLTVHEFYPDPQLVQLIYMAFDGNRELRILDQEVQVAGNEILARRGAYLPFVTIGGRAGMVRSSLYTPMGAAESQLLIPDGRRFPDPVGDFFGLFNFDWELDPWRRLRNARDAQAQRYFAAIEKRNYFATQLVAEVAQNYYTLMSLDKRLEVLDKNIALQQHSFEIAKAKKDAGQGSELAVQRFQAEVRRNQSEKLIVRQEIIEAENRVNFAVNRYPQPVERSAEEFFDVTIHALNVGVPSQLLLNRPDIRQAERELQAAGLDVLVARAEFFPRVSINAGLGLSAFNPGYLFTTPEALMANAAGNIVAPLVNKRAIQAAFMSANALQLEALYNYQKTVLEAFTEVVNQMNMVENYRQSIDLKRQQLIALEASVDAAGKLFQAARVEYIEVLFAQRDLLEARTVVIDTKKQQLTAVVNAYQALGGGAQTVGGSKDWPQVPPSLLSSVHPKKKFWCWP